MAQNTYKQQREEKQESNVRFKLDFLNDRKFQLAGGFILLLGGLFLFIAFISYFRTGKADQSVVEGLFNTNIKESGREVQNWFGIVGAIAGHFFVFLWFGIAAILIPPLMILISLRIILKSRIYPLTRAFAFVLFYLLWTGTFFGYFMLSSDEVTEWSFISGGVGFELAIVMDSFMGWGTPLFLIFLLVIFNMYFYNITSIPWLQKYIDRFNDRFSKKEPAEEEGQDGAAPVALLEEEEETEPAEEELEEEEPFTLKGIEEKPKTNPRELELILQKVKMEVEEEEKEFEDDDEDDLLPIKRPANDPAFFVQLPNKELSTEELEELGIELERPEHEEVGGVVMENYDPTLDLPRYRYPGPDLLIDYPVRDIQVSKDELEQNKDRIVETLINFKIGIASIKATIGPTVTLYEIVPEAGVKISKIKNLEDDIALSLAALGIRIIAPIPGKGTIGIEVPNKNKEMVDIKSVITTEKFMKSDKDLPIVLGKTISNEVYVTDLAKMPHLLMAGATGQGKSVGLNMIIASLIYKKHPSQLKFVMVDPKKVELTLFNKLERHFLAKLPDSAEAIITDTSKVVNTLNSLCIEMDSRYDLLKDAGCRNLKEYNKKFVSRRLNPEKGHRYLPYIVLVIDELADLMMTAGKEVETPIARLAQLARAIGIHLIVATQRPSVNVITGIIKANFPARLSFRVTSKIDSRTILDAGGADQLVGQGDMLLSMGSEIIRLQCAFVDTPEIDRIVEFIADQRGYDSAYLLPEYIGDEEGSSMSVDLSDRDALFDEAARLLVTHQQGSTSLIQRKMKLGYNRAGRLIDQLEAAGIVGPFEGSKAREVLIKDEYSLEQLLSSLDN